MPLDLSHFRLHSLPLLSTQSLRKRGATTGKTPPLSPFLPNPDPQVSMFWSNSTFWLSESVTPGEGMKSACQTPCTFPSALGWVAARTSPGRQC